MLAGISHDLRTPLSRLRLEVEMSVSDPVIRRHMSLDIEQAQNTLGQFMAYARPLGAQDMDLQPLPLDEVVHQVLEPYRSRPDLRLSGSIPGGLKVYADRVALDRCVVNVLENALRYAKTPGTQHSELHLEVQARGDWLELAFTDQGPGVPSETLTRLTQPFFRVDTSRKDAHGAGLGLAIVEHTMKHMGGQLSMTSHAPHGLRVVLALRRAI